MSGDGSVLVRLSGKQGRSAGDCSACGRGERRVWLHTLGGGVTPSRIELCDRCHEAIVAVAHAEPEDAGDCECSPPCPRPDACAECGDGPGVGWALTKFASALALYPRTHSEDYPAFCPDCYQRVNRRLMEEARKAVKGIHPSLAGYAINAIEDIEREAEESPAGGRRVGVVPAAETSALDR